MKVRINFDGHEFEVESEDATEYKKIRVSFESIIKIESRREERTRELADRGQIPYLFIQQAAIDPYELVIEAERNAKIHKAINKLPHRQKEAVEKVIFEERKIVDVAKEMGIDESSLRERLKRAFNNLRKILIS